MGKRGTDHLTGKTSKTTFAKDDKENNILNDLLEDMSNLLDDTFQEKLKLNQSP